MAGLVAKGGDKKYLITGRCEAPILVSIPAPNPPPLSHLTLHTHMGNIVQMCMTAKPHWFGENFPFAKSSFLFSSSFLSFFFHHCLFIPPSPLQIFSHAENDRLDE